MSLHSKGLNTCFMSVISITLHATTSYKH